MSIDMKEFLNQTVKIMPNVLSQGVSGETVLLDLKGENYFGLDIVGTRVWQLLQEQDDVQKIYGTMLEEYDVDAVQLQNDLSELIKKLVDAGLVETTGV